MAEVSSSPLSQFYVYILKSEVNDRYYTGSTKNPSHRLARHNAGMVQSTKSYMTIG